MIPMMYVTVISPDMSSDIGSHEKRIDLYCIVFMSGEQRWLQDVTSGLCL